MYLIFFSGFVIELRQLLGPIIPLPRALVRDVAVVVNRLPLGFGADDECVKLPEILKEIAGAVGDPSDDGLLARDDPPDEDFIVRKGKTVDRLDELFPRAILVIFVA